MTASTVVGKLQVLFIINSAIYATREELANLAPQSLSTPFAAVNTKAFTTDITIGDNLRAVKPRGI
jgi:hypothetical protein